MSSTEPRSQGHQVGVAGATNVCRAAPLSPTGPAVSTGSTMVIALDRDAPVSAATTSPSAFAEVRPAYCLLGASLATALAGAGLVTSAVDGPSAVEIVRPILVVLWAAAGLLLGLRRR